MRLPSDGPLSRLAFLFSRRFLKFAAVGTAGVVVNLGALAVLADMVHLHENLASALAIELSILFNFALNDTWTFRDRRSAQSSRTGRALQYHMVTAVGALIQWVVFVLANLGWFLLWTDGAVAYFTAETWLANALLPVTRPPDVGLFMYVSQCMGIGAGMSWNYLVNLHWTWGTRQQAPADDDQAYADDDPEPPAVALNTRPSPEIR